MTYRILNNEIDIPILRILRGDPITEFNPKKEGIKRAFNVRITYTKNIEFDNIYTIERNYYVKSIHSFVFEAKTAEIIHNILNPDNNRLNNLLSTQTIRNKTTVRYIWEVEPETADILESGFEDRIERADPFYGIIKWFRDIKNRLF